MPQTRRSSMKKADAASPSRGSDPFDDDDEEAPRTPVRSGDGRSFSSNLSSSGGRGVSEDPTATHPRHWQNTGNRARPSGGGGLAKRSRMFDASSVVSDAPRRRRGRAASTSRPRRVDATAVPLAAGPTASQRIRPDRREPVLIAASPS